MSLKKLKLHKSKTGETYHISLPKEIVEEIAKWPPGQQLEVVWIEKGKSEVLNKPYFRISKLDNLWANNKE